MFLIRVSFTFFKITDILAGILQFPFYGYKRIHALNFGAIGTIIGHEIVHSFDNKGRQFDKNGNLKQWWGNETSDLYNTKMQCFIDQYDAFEIEEIRNITGDKKTISGFQSVGENIADAGGIHQAFKAYKHFIRKNGPDKHLPGWMQNFSPDQLFFISFANKNCEKMTIEMLKTAGFDAHLPNKFRTIGALMNSADFSKAFNCPVGSPMNPLKRCEMW